MARRSALVLILTALAAHSPVSAEEPLRDFAYRSGVLLGRATACGFNRDRLQKLSYLIGLHADALAARDQIGFEAAYAISYSRSVIGSLQGFRDQVDQEPMDCASIDIEIRAFADQSAMVIKRVVDDLAADR